MQHRSREREASPEHMKIQDAQSQPQGSRPNHTPEKLLLPLLFSQSLPNHTFPRGRETRRSPSQCLLGSCVVSQPTRLVGV